MSKVIIEINSDGLTKEETIKEMKEEMKRLAFEWDSTSMETEVESKIHEALKGLTIREASKLLKKVNGVIMGSAPIDLGFNKVL
ncbi:hypothetical protein GCM10011409_19140 [Lentibacillus populi]|uniref:Uncharacterized protein n=1 Tax=Lentibacillus populi TaxID=1827502 RepID=A0A9W5TY82_9BACI|nr:hypothetical protein [Lentibacillus populi]GGB41767.1 hypothetical protein GCM10011409_19140 [Lentibacillus populi]